MLWSGRNRQAVHEAVRESVYGRAEDVSLNRSCNKAVLDVDFAVAHVYVDHAAVDALPLVPALHSQFVMAERIVQNGFHLDVAHGGRGLGVLAQELLDGYRFRRVVSVVAFGAWLLT